MRIFVVIVAVVVAVVVFFYVSFFDSYFVECLAAFNCREVFWKKGVLKIYKINSKQLGSRQSLLRSTCGRFIFGKVKGFQQVTLR